MDTFMIFKTSLQAEHPPLSLSNALLALWYDANGNWDKAHDYAQIDDNMDSSWVHAYLHRKEGDQFNASYWYRRAGKPVCKLSLDEEWTQITKELLQYVKQ